MKMAHRRSSLLKIKPKQRIGGTIHRGDVPKFWPSDEEIVPEVISPSLRYCVV